MKIKKCFAETRQVRCCIRHLAQRAMKVSPRCLLGRRGAQFQLAIDSAREVAQMWLCSAPSASGGLTIFSE
jgi:hypothetical protein